jgi:hypothetical protein
VVVWVVQYKAGIGGMNGIMLGDFPLRMEMLLGVRSTRERLVG